MKFIRKKASLPPPGLLTVAAMLPAEWEKRLVDVNVRKLRDKDLAWADVVFISGMIAQQDSAHELITRCHAADKTIVAGGPLFGVEQEQFPGVDHFVLNEAEVTLPEFLRDFADGGARRVYASAEFPDIRQTPAPLWELADLRRYASMMRVVLTRLSVRLRVLQHHRDVRPPAPYQDDGVGARRVGWALVGLLQAIPGTKLHQRLHRQGRLLGHTTGYNGDGTTNFIPHMNRETLSAGYRKIMGYIYAPGPSRTLSLLGAAALDVLPPSVSRALGRHALHLRPPLPQNLPDAGVVTWTQTSILQTRRSA